MSERERERERESEGERERESERERGREAYTCSATDVNSYSHFLLDLEILTGEKASGTVELEQSLE